MKQKRSAFIRNISLQTLLIALLFIVSIGIFALIAHEVVGENEDWFDSKAFNFLKSYSTPPVIEFFKVITFFGSTWFLLPFYCLLVIYLLIKRRKEDAILIAIISITSSLLLFGLKQYFSRHRPDLPLFKALTNYSFPSGHALSSFILCSVLIFLAWKSGWKKAWKWLITVLLLTVAMLIGISRIVLRYHYASDVLAGFCLGFAWTILSFWVQRKLKSKENSL